MAVLFLAPGLLLLWALSGCSDSANKMKVLDTSPSPHAANVAPDSAITVKFSASVKENSLNENNFQVSGSESGKKAGTITYDDPTRTATYGRSTPFEDGETVTVSLSGSIQGKSGALLRSKIFSFTIRPAVEPPPPPPDGAVKSSTPAPFASGIPANALVYVEFTERMDPLTFSADSVRMAGSFQGRINAQIADIQITATRLTLMPVRQFLPDEWITVTLSSGIRTAVGGKFPGSVFSFRAASAAPTAPRLPGDVFPAGGTVTGSRLADLDLDGKLDLVYSLSADRKIHVARGLGTGRFEAALELDAGQAVTALSMADLNDDGRIDALAGTVDRAVAWRGRGPGIAFEDPDTLPTAIAVRGIAVGHLDRHGPPDVLLDTDRGIRIYIDGLVGAPALILGDTRIATTELILSDLDLDGLPDLLYGDSTGRRLALLRGGGPSHLLPAETIALDGEASWAAVEDLDHDGKPEIIAHWASATDTGLGILPVPDGSAGNAITRLEPLAPSARRTYALADLTGDGPADLMAADPEAPAVLLFQNTNGVFDLSAPLVIASDFAAERILAGDITGDGVLDLVVPAGTEFHVLLSEGGHEPPPPADVRLSVGSLEANAGETAKRIAISLTSDVTIAAYTVGIAFDPLAMTVTAVDLEATASSALAPEFVVPSVHNADGFASIAVIFDFMPPFDGQTLAPGTDMAIATLKFDVPAAATAGSYRIETKNGLGSPPVNNTVVHEGTTVEPALGFGTLTVHTPPPVNPNKIRIGSLEAALGATGQRLAVTITCVDAIDAYSVVAAYDPAATKVTTFDAAGSVTQTLNPEFVVPSIRETQNYFAYSVIFDFMPPFDHQQILPGADQLLFKIVFDARRRGPGRPPVHPEERPGRSSPAELPGGQWRQHLPGAHQRHRDGHGNPASQEVHPGRCERRQEGGHLGLHLPLDLHLQERPHAPVHVRRGPG